jgi:hypothetical protein
VAEWAVLNKINKNADVRVGRNGKIFIIIISLLMSPLLGHRPSLWITHKIKEWHLSLSSMDVIKGDLRINRICT